MKQLLKRVAVRLGVEIHRKEEVVSQFLFPGRRRRGE
jgi:hypothetical protein